MAQKYITVLMEMASLLLRVLSQIVKQLYPVGSPYSSLGKGRLLLGGGGGGGGGEIPGFHPLMKP